MKAVFIIVHHEGNRARAEMLPQEAGDGNDEAFVSQNPLPAAY